MLENYFPELALYRHWLAQWVWTIIYKCKNHCKWLLPHIYFVLTTGKICYPLPHKFLVPFQIIKLLLKAPEYVSTLSSLAYSAPATLIWTLIYQAQGFASAVLLTTHPYGIFPHPLQLCSVVSLWVSPILALPSTSTSSHLRLSFSMGYVCLPYTYHHHLLWFHYFCKVSFPQLESRFQKGEEFSLIHIHA